MSEPLTEKLQHRISTFIATYGESAFQTALTNYENMHQNYYFHNGTCTKIIPISSIIYIEIYNHDVHIHTTDGDYKKYGTLKSEYEILKTFDFIKCSQSHLVPITNISEIRTNSVILSSGFELQLSRNYSKSVRNAYLLYYNLYK